MRAIAEFIFCSNSSSKSPPKSVNPAVPPQFMPKNGVNSQSADAFAGAAANTISARTVVIATFRSAMPTSLLLAVSRVYPLPPCGRRMMQSGTRQVRPLQGMCPTARVPRLRRTEERIPAHLPAGCSATRGNGVELQLAREFLNEGPGSFDVPFHGVEITDREPKRIAPVELGVDRKISPEALMRSSRCPLNSSDSFARKQTTLKGAGAVLSKSAELSTHAANSRARRMCSPSRVRMPSAPKCRSTIHSLGARESGGRAECRCP